MFSKLLALPFVLLLSYFGYMVWQGDESYLIYTIPLFLILVGIYVLAPQINWWWYERNPPDVDTPVRMMLERLNPFYKGLSEKDQQKFRQRMEMFVKGVNFMPKGWDKMPEDVKYAVAANAVQLNFNKKELLFPKYENVVVYPQAFPSPQYPESFHPSEVYKEDGVVLFSAEHLLASLMEPNKYYNVAMYEYVKVYMDAYPNKPLPRFTEEDWPALSKVSPFSETLIKKTLNVPDIDPSVVAASLYQTFPAKFKKIFPDKAKQLDAVFGVA